MTEPDPYTEQVLPDEASTQHSQECRNQLRFNNLYVTWSCCSYVTDWSGKYFWYQSATIGSVSTQTIFFSDWTCPRPPYSDFLPIFYELLGFVVNNTGLNSHKLLAPHWITNKLQCSKVVCTRGIKDSVYQIAISSLVNRILINCHWCLKLYYCHLHVSFTRRLPSFRRAPKNPYCPQNKSCRAANVISGPTGLSCRANNDIGR